MPRLSLVPFAPCSPAKTLVTPSQCISTSGLVCIDDSISDRATLLESIQPGLEPLVLEQSLASTDKPTLNPITLITDWIHNNPTATELHLVAHGEPGGLHLGSIMFSWRTIQRYAEQIRTWRSLQSIYIYGCNVAIGDAGSEFLETLHLLTGATVYASSTPVGTQRLGGNWQLDSFFGASTAVDPVVLAFSESVQSTYSHVFGTYKVSTLADEEDGGNGGRKLSLREAITLANANPGKDTILFKASLKNGTIVLDKGEIEITDDVDIRGLGADKLTISGNNQSSIFVIPPSPDSYFSYSQNNANVSIDGLTLTQGGNKANLSSFRDAGAAIVNNGNLTLKNSVVSGSTSGIIRSRYEYYDSVDVQVENSEITNNAKVAIETVSVTINNSIISRNGSNTVDSRGYDAQVEIKNSTISNNDGSISSYGYSGRISIEDSVITNNDGVIESRSSFPAEGSVSIARSIVSGNSGGIIAPPGIFYGTVSIDRSQVVNNGSGISAGFAQISHSNISGNGTDGVYTSASLDVFSSTISNNNGNGLFAGYYSGRISVINSTVSGNAGDGLRVKDPEDFTRVNISNSTITNNGRSGGRGVVLEVGTSENVRPVTIHNSIVSGNYGDADVEGPFDSEGNNLIGNGDGATGLIDGVNGDQVGTTAIPIDARLGPLQDNGGLLETHALLPDSPAIDAGNNALIPANVTTDQRGFGFNRIFNGVVDIGAFEVGPRPGANLVGTSRKDVLTGTDLTERIEGLQGNDRIDGKAGNDLIVGGLGRDKLTGGDGSDTFVYETAQDRGDKIQDFEVGIDTIDLSSIFAESPSVFGYGGDRFDYVRLSQRSAGVRVELDLAGSRGDNFVQIALLKGVEVSDLSSDDFLLR